MVGDRGRGRGVVPRPRRGPAVAVTAALTAAALLTGCQSGQEPSAATPAAAASPTRPPVCEDVRSALPCATVSVDGAEHRYSVVRPSGASATGRAVLVDLGGPGRALFASQDLLQFAAAWPGDEALLFLEEPWVLQDVPAGCRQALAATYRAVHGAAGVPPSRAAADEAGRSLAGDCRLDEPGTWGWTPAAYREVATAAARAEGLELTGVVGTSFGASRATGVRDLPDLEWIVLNSPSPRRATGADYLAARARGALTDLSGLCEGCSDPAVAQVELEGIAARWDAAPVELATRTPLVTGTDVLGAVVTLPYLPAEARDAAVTALRGEPPAGATTVGELSDSLLLRYGTEDVSPAMLAYLQEVCATYAPWPATSGGTGVEGVLGRLHAACSGVPARPEQPARPAADRDGPAVCLARSTDDRVTPAAFAETWLADLRPVETVEVPGRTHAAPALAAECATRLAARAG